MQNIKAGACVRSMVASRASSIEDVLKKMGGRDYVIEKKFDGCRLQIHVNGDYVNMFTRNQNDDFAYYRPIKPLVLQFCKSKRVCLPTANSVLALQM